MSSSPRSQRRGLTVSFAESVSLDNETHESGTSSTSSSETSSPVATKVPPLARKRSKLADDDDAEIARKEKEVEERSAAKAKSDPRLQEALRVVRGMTSPRLKEQCLISEWATMRTETEREILLEAVMDPSFWSEVKEVAMTDVDAVLEEEDDVDTESRLYHMFKAFDRDGTGMISANEMHQMLLYMGVNATEDEVDGMIKQCDADGDGKIVQAEFMLIMKRAQAGQFSIAAPTRQTIRRASFRMAQHQRPVFNRSDMLMS